MQSFFSEIGFTVQVNIRRDILTHLDTESYKNLRFNLNKKQKKQCI